MTPGGPLDPLEQDLLSQLSEALAPSSGATPPPVGAGGAELVALRAAVVARDWRWVPLLAHVSWVATVAVVGALMAVGAVVTSLAIAPTSSGIHQSHPHGSSSHGSQVTYLPGSGGSTTPPGPNGSSTTTGKAPVVGHKVVPVVHVPGGGGSGVSTSVGGVVVDNPGNQLDLVGVVGGGEGHVADARSGRLAGDLSGRGVDGETWRQVGRRPGVRRVAACGRER